MRVREFDQDSAINTVLNPKIWEASGQLKSSVRGALLRIAEDFYQYVGIEFPVIDLVITGSNVNYNYTSHSDLDLHLVTDYAKIRCDRELEELFDTKRLLYEQEFDIQIYGIPVTLYVEDRARPGVSRGLYSVKHSEWINQPSKVLPEFDRREIQDQLESWQKIIEKTIEQRDLQAARRVLKLLRQYRRWGLSQSQGEFSTANMVYKLLRDQKLLSQLSAVVDSLHSRSLSLPN